MVLFPLLNGSNQDNFVFWQVKHSVKHPGFLVVLTDSQIVIL